MKKILSVFLALAMLLCALPVMADTSYTGTGKGFNGELKVTVTLTDNGAIANVVVDAVAASLILEGYLTFKKSH